MKAVHYWHTLPWWQCGFPRDNLVKTMSLQDTGWKGTVCTNCPFILGRVWKIVFRLLMFLMLFDVMDVLAPGKGMCLENLISQKPALACQQDAKSLAFINKGRTGCPSSPGSLGWVKGCTDLGSATGLFPESPDLWCLCYLSSPEPQRPAHPLCSGLHRDVMWRPHFCLDRSNTQASSTGF